MDWRATHIAASLAAAAYSETTVQAAAAFNALGYTMAGQYLNADHQAFLLRNEEGYALAISGTRFGRSLADLLDDADIVGVDLGDGVEVARGPYRGVSAMWVWALSLVPANATFSVVGHSLGGERTLLTGLYVAPERIRSLYAFEAPKCGNRALWNRLANTLRSVTCVINGRDLWAGWPVVSTWEHPPIQHIHLEGDGWTLVGPDEWPPAVDAADHSIAVVVERLGRIAAQPAA